MAASPSNILHRALGGDGWTMSTHELITCFMRAGYGVTKAKKHIQKYAEYGLIEQDSEGYWSGVDI